MADEHAQAAPIVSCNDASSSSTSSAAPGVHRQGENKSKAYVVFAQPPETRGAVLWEIEGGRIQVGF
jgi:hypothetical protein